MIGFLRWARGISLGVLNSVAKFVVLLLMIAAVFAIIGVVRGDGLPSNMVLTLDLRNSLPDSFAAPAFALGKKPLTVVDTVLALDRAGRDSRVKGVFMKVGGAEMPVPQAEELAEALKRFRATGKFVIVYSQGFFSTGLGDYLVATPANEIWMQPKAVFSASGAAAGSIFFRGLFDKIDAVPQIAKRADYKSAADTYMEKGYTPADREQMTALLQSWYDSASTATAAARKLDPAKVLAALDKSPQFAADAKRAGLIDVLGYDDQAERSARKKGKDAESVPMREYIEATEDESRYGDGQKIALIEASGEIVDGTAGGDGLFASNTVIAGDDFADAIRQATDDKRIKAILLRVDSPGGSVTASDQILHALKEAQSAGKPVVVSMGTLAASGGYYISASADRIIAQPGTITGSIGVLTGKVSFGKSLEKLGIGTDELGIGKNALFNSTFTPFTEEQWQNLNHQADVIYADFTQKVAAGRRLPIEKVREIAKGRVWSGADARRRGLVDDLGGFWTAVDAAKKAAKLDAGAHVTFVQYPRHRGFFENLDRMFGDTAAGAQALQTMATLANSPVGRALSEAVSETPRGRVELRATGLPVN